MKSLSWKHTHSSPHWHFFGRMEINAFWFFHNPLCNWIWLLSNHVHILPISHHIVNILFKGWHFDFPINVFVIRFKTFMQNHVFSCPFLTTFIFFLKDENAFWFPHNFLCNWLWNLCESCSYLAHSSCHIHILFGEDDGFWFLFKIEFFENFVIHVHVSYPLSSPTKSTFILEDDDVVWFFSSRLIYLKFLSFIFVCLARYLHPPKQHSSWRMMMSFDFPSRLTYLKFISFMFMCLDVIFTHQINVHLGGWWCLLISLQNWILYNLNHSCSCVLPVIFTHQINIHLGGWWCLLISLLHYWIYFITFYIFHFIVFWVCIKIKFVKFFDLG